MKKYISDGTWFEKGSKCELVIDCDEIGGIFKGIHEGHLDEELCSWDEFEVVEEE